MKNIWEPFYDVCPCPVQVELWSLSSSTSLAIQSKTKHTSYSTMISLKLDLSIKDKFMQIYIILKETCQEHVLMRTQKRYLQTIDEVATASLSPPCPTLA